MGLIEQVLTLVFGGGRNAVAETVEVFRENADKGSERDLARMDAVLKQFSAEFGGTRKHWFDVLIDGLNRVPRPAMALGTIGLFVSAMVDPSWFGARMVGLALVPEPLWWLLGAIVSFYFGARHQAKSQDFQRSIAQSLGRARSVADSITALEAGAETSAPVVQLEEAVPETPEVTRAATAPLNRTGNAHNAALRDWRLARG